MNRIKVLILRRAESELTVGERAALTAAFPDQKFEFVTTNPRDYEEHAVDCARLEPRVVLLPRERPLPSLAMEHGFVHVTVGPDGYLHKLLPLIPKFEHFVSEE